MENEEQESGLSAKELHKLRDELWVVIPFFAMSLLFFLGSFGFKRGAGYVPGVIGAVTAILTGMRLYHIIFPQSKIGEFKEAGLAGEFDHIKETIEEETLKGHYEEPKGKVVTFADERKAFFGLIGCFILFLCFGYIIGGLFTVVAACYYYNFRDKLQIAIVLASLFFIVYVVLYKLLEGPEDFGLLLAPILQSLDLI